MAKISVYVPDQLLEAWRSYTDDRPDLSTSGVLQRGLIAVMAGREEAGTPDRVPASG